MALPGAYISKKKDGTIYYRASFTYKNKHISLGSFDTEKEANLAYLEATKLVNLDCDISEYHTYCSLLTFDKYVSILNLRDKDMYLKTPIYLMNKYFIYFLSENEPLKFDVDDLFFYSTHTIMKRGGYLFVADYGMQINILSRYGIKNHAVKGKDYIFINGDESDYRYSNIKVINHYYGVEKIIVNGRDRYRAKIHINGNFTIGTYDTEEEAAVAYNKTIELLKQKGFDKNFPENYLGDIPPITYAKYYNSVRISKRIRKLEFE